MGFDVGGSGQPSLGGSGAIVEARDIMDLGGTLANNPTGGWTDGGFMRYGGSFVTLGGTNVFAAGSAGSAPQRGLIPVGGSYYRRARSTAVTNVPLDWYSGVCPHPTVVRPVDAGLYEPFAVWEVGVTMLTDALPVGALDRDMGLVFICSGITGYPTYLRSGISPGNDHPGFGVVFDGPNLDLLWIDKKSGVSGGSLLTETEVLRAGWGANRPVSLRFRFHSATVAREARLEVSINGQIALERSWGPGTVLPTAADAVASPALGYYRPIMRASQLSTNLNALLFRNFYVRAASADSLLD